MGYYAIERLTGKARWLGFNAWHYCEPGTAYLNSFTLVLEKNGTKVEFTSVREALEFLNSVPAKGSSHVL